MLAHGAAAEEERWTCRDSVWGANVIVHLSVDPEKRDGQIRVAGGVGGEVLRVTADTPARQGGGGSAHLAVASGEFGAGSLPTK